MVALELINNSIPQLQLEDTVGRALQLISDFKTSHLPVVSENAYLGIISEEDLMDVSNKNVSIGTLQRDFIPVSIQENDHFLHAANLLNQFQTDIIPVINVEKNLVGIITAQSLLRVLGQFAGSEETGGLVVLEMERYQFAISEISRIVESNEATIMHLNTTVQSESGLLRVTIHVNKKEIAVIVAAFERYEYNVVYYFGEERFENEIQSNYRHLMNYLDI
ncbi:MAG: CBS domain-containing protein [Ginsengibacter sp.]